jgi:dienelactone hydrolase
VLAVALQVGTLAACSDAPATNGLAATAATGTAATAADGAPAPAVNDAAAERGGLLEQHLAIPVAVPGVVGATHAELASLIVRPPGPGPFPLAVISHGSPRSPRERPGMTPEGFAGAARAFARRGFVAVVPMRRGYGATGGRWAEDYGSCANPYYYEAGLEAAQDIAGAIAWARLLPYVDASRAVAVGVSAGGFGSVALSTMAVPGLVAVVNFAGGRGSRGRDDVCVPDMLVRAMARYGARSRVPQLWIYAENDLFFGPELARRMHDAFIAAGGRAELVRAPAFDRDGHRLFGTGGPAAWGRYVDPFLRGQGLPAAARLAVPLALLTP